MEETVEQEIVEQAVDVKEAEDAPVQDTDIADILAEFNLKTDMMFTYAIDIMQDLVERVEKLEARIEDYNKRAPHRL